MYNCGFLGGSTGKFSGPLEFVKSAESSVFQVGMSFFASGTDLC